VGRLLETRIGAGEYGTLALPAERELATELGVSRVTIRRVLQELEGRGVLRRLPNRRLAPAARSGAHDKQAPTAILMPSMEAETVSSNQMRWYQNVATVAAQTDRRVHMHHYFHWGDRIVTEVLRDYEQVFMIPSAEKMNSEVKALIRDKPQLVALSVDLTKLKVPSILAYRPSDVGLVLDHLGAGSYKKVHCFNVQGHDSVIDRRIETWRDWRSKHNIDGDLIEVHWEPGENVFEVAIDAASRSLKNLNRDTAIFSTTLPGAIGAIHAAEDLGLNVGRELGVVTVDGEGLAQYMLPSITCLRQPDVKPLIQRAFEWFDDGSGQWEGPSLLHPKRSKLFVGGSSRARNS
jgi:DNA-binding LacI/PurR family transcriptional regulator